MKVNKIAMFLVLVLFMVLPLSSTLAQYNKNSAVLPKKSAPDGMMELPSNAGRILTSRMSGTTSARKMLIALRMAVADYFDSNITLTSAFADKADQNLQASFFAKLGGVPVRGVIAIEMHGSSGQTTMIFDQSLKFSQTFARMAEIVEEAPAQKTESAPMPVPQLTMTSLLDGSGQMGLAPGWRITGSYKGTVDVVGPSGEMMGLGGYAVVTSKATNGLFAGIPMVDFNDPVRAALDYAEYNANQARMKGMAESRITKVWDTYPIPFGGHKAAFMRFSAVLNGQPYEALGLYSIMPTDVTQAVLYMSYVVAPPEVFKRSLPTMWAMWQSWGVKDEVFRERLTSALKSMRETGDILTGVNQNRQDTYTRVNKAWDQYIRDESTMYDPNTGNRYNVTNGQRPANLPQNVKLGDLQPVPLKDL